MSRPSSPNVKAKSPKIALPEMDTSLEGWIYNIRTVLHFPSTIITVFILLISGTFIESASRKSLDFIDNIVGRILIFVLPILLAYLLDWPTGLLAATVALILFSRIHKNDRENAAEGFSNGLNNDMVQTTKLVSNSHRWFVEKVLGEMPVAISSDRIQTKRYEENDTRTSSSSSMSSSYTSDSTK